MKNKFLAGFLLAITLVATVAAKNRIEQLLLTSDGDAGGFQISNLGSPTNSSNAATLSYVTNQIATTGTNYAPAAGSTNVHILGVITNGPTTLAGYGITATATNIANTAAGTIAATNVQTALNELDTEKVPTTRTVSTSLPLTGGGNLGTNLSLSINAAGVLTDGYVTATTQTFSGNKTFAGDVSVNGNTTLGDASGDSITITGKARGANQTADYGDSYLTRDLVDARGSYFVWCGVTSVSQAKADGAAWLMTPGASTASGNGVAASVPAEMTKFRVRVSAGFTTNPSADVFPIYVRMQSQAINSTTPYVEASTGTQLGQAGCYPNDTTGLPGTLVDLAASVAGYANTFAFTSDWITIPAAWQTNAAAQGGYGVVGIVWGNKSGGSLTDNGAQNHSIYGHIEFRR